MHPHGGATQGYEDSHGSKSTEVRWSVARSERGPKRIDSILDTYQPSSLSAYLNPSTHRFAPRPSSPPRRRIICHNFTTFARTHEDSSSQYRAFATVDFEVPAHLSDVEKWSKVEVKVKYMGQPLCDEEIEKAENHVARMTSSKKIDEKDHVAQGESGSLTPNSLTPTTTFNTKMIWKDMEDGKNLALAYNMASMLGGSIKIVREFR